MAAKSTLKEGSEMIYILTTILFYLAAGFFFSNNYHLRTRKRRLHLVFTWLFVIVAGLIGLAMKPKKHIDK